MRRLKTILQSKYPIKVTAIIIVILDLIFLKCYTYQSKYSGSETKITGIVTNIIDNSDYLTIYLQAKELILVKYYYQDKNNLPQIELGSRVSIEGTIERPFNNTIKNLFNYKDYLYSKKIYYLMNTSKLNIINSNQSLLYYLKNKIITRINTIKKSDPYLKTFILGDMNYIETTTKKSYQANGISHLFSISGMHISIFSALILKILKKFSYSNKYNYSFVILFLLFYMFLVNYTASIIRSFTMYFLKSLNSTFNLKIKTLDISLLTLIILIIIDPRIILNIGFQFSYLVSFTLILTSKKLNKHKNYFLKLLLSSSVAFLVSIPICLTNYYQINAISRVLNLFLVPLVSFLIFPLSLLTLILPKLDGILSIFITIIESISNFCSQINFLTITLPKCNFIVLMLYYFLIFLTLHNYKNIFLLIILIIINHNIAYFNSNLNVTMLDVGQGDSLVLNFPHNKLNILIDTGGNPNSNKNYLSQNIITYLKSIGIYKLDYLIITHGDYDHMGEAINLVNNFKVEKLIFNCGEYNDLEKKLIKVLDKKKIKYYSCIKELNADNNKLYFLQTKEYDNENDNSNVIYTELDGYKFMFMGDAGVEKERDILKKYNISNIDVLKVGHHGSKTSSGKKFIDEINPKYSIISVGKNNRYGHPNKEVLDTLNDSKIYRTDQDGSIMFKIKKDKLQIETCSP